MTTTTYNEYLRDLDTIRNKSLRAVDWWAEAIGPSSALEVATPEESVVAFVQESRLRGTRRWLAYQRYKILTQDIEDLVNARLCDLQSDQEILRKICAWVDNVANLGLDVADRVCTVWNAQPMRVIKNDESATKEVNRLFAEMGFARFSKEWNRQAWFLGPIVVIPTPKAHGMVYETLLPHQYEAVRDPENPFGDPLAVTWQTGKGRFVYLDSRAWHYYRAESGRVTLENTVKHNLGRFPGAHLRFSQSCSAPWHGNAREHQRLVDATLKIADLEARLGFVRKSQSFSLLTMIGNLAGIPDRQLKTPEGALVGDTGENSSPELTQIQSLPNDTSPVNFADHMKLVTNHIARAYDGHLSDDGSVVYTDDQLNAIRNEQITFAVEFEGRLLSKKLDMARSMPHYADRSLLPGEQARKAYSVKFPPLAVSYQDPDQRRKQDDWEMSKGLTDFAKLAMRRHPGMTYDEAREFVMANVKAQIPIIELITRRDLSMQPPSTTVGLKTAAQQYGAQGPEERDREDADRSE